MTHARSRRSFAVTAVTAVTCTAPLAARPGAGLAGAGRLPGVRRVAVLAAAALLLGGCQATETYFIDRGLDASDVVRAQAMAGKGFDAKLELTHFAGLGMGVYDASACGLGTRTVGCWHEEVSDLGFWLNCWDRKLVTEGSEPSRAHSLDAAWALGGEGPPYVASEDGFASWLSARACLFLFVGAEVEVRGGEVLDFAAGLVGLDPSHDDTLAVPAPPGKPTFFHASIRSYGATRSSWPPIAPGCGRIVLLARRGGWVTLDGAPVLAVDGTPIAYDPGTEVYVYADAPAGQRVLSADGRKVGIVQVPPAAVTYVALSADRPAWAQPADKDDTSSRLQLCVVDAARAEKLLDLMRYVGQPTASAP